MVQNNNTTILLIDDSETILQSYQDYLDDIGYHTIIAKNGRIGLDLFYKEKVDLVLVDLRMPEVDGLEVLAAIKKKSPQTPTIVISGTGIIEYAIESVRQGAWDYLLKPIENFSVLSHAVNNALEKSRLKKDNAQYQQNLEKMIIEQTKELQKKTEDLEKEIIRRLKAENEIKKSLQEKNILLQEVHHRVKNNMAVIYSLIGLKEESLTNKLVKQLFLDTRQRIKSMALVQQIQASLTIDVSKGTKYIIDIPCDQNHHCLDHEEKM